MIVIIIDQSTNIDPLEDIKSYILLEVIEPSTKVISFCNKTLFWRIAEVDFTKLSNIAWDRYSGVNSAAPQYFIHAYIWCDDYEGELALVNRLHHYKMVVT